MYTCRNIEPTTHDNVCSSHVVSSVTRNTCSHFTVPGDNGRQRFPKIEMLKGGVDFQAETLNKKTGQPGDYFMVLLEMEESLMEPLVWKQKRGLEGWLKFGGTVMFQLSGGGIEKIIKEKIAKECKEQGVERKKKVLTEEQRKERRDRRNARKVDKMLEAEEIKKKGGGAKKMKK